MSRTTATAPSALSMLALGAALTAGLGGTAQAAAAAPASLPTALAQHAATSAQAATTPTLSRGQTLRSGQSLVSPSGRYSVALLADGRLVYRDRPNRLNPQGTQVALFAVPGRDTAGADLVFQDDGTLVLRLRDGSALDPLSSAGKGGQRLAVQDDGNVVLYTAAGTSVPLFSQDGDLTVDPLGMLGNVSSLLSRGQVMLPGDQRVNGDDGTRLVMQTDGNLVVYQSGRARFASGTQGHPGAAAIMQADGNFVVYGPRNEVLFTSGTAGRGPGADVVLQVGQGTFHLYRLLDSETPALFDALWTTSTVLPGDYLFGGDRFGDERRTSPQGRYQLSLTDGGNLSVVGDRGVVFSSRTSGGSDAFGVMQTDGNFVVYGAQDAVLFQTRTAGHPGARLVVQDDGNLVVYSPANKALFSTLR